MKHGVAGHFREQWSWNRYFPYTNTYLSRPLCGVNCFCSCDISNRQIDIHFDLTANIHPGSIHAPHAYSFIAACDSLSNLLEHQSHITYFYLQVAFVQVQRVPLQQHMNICKYVSFFMHLTCFWFKLSVLMGYLQLNYTCLMCDWQFWYLDCVNCCSDRQVKQLSDYPVLSVVDLPYLALLTQCRQPHNLNYQTELRPLIVLSGSSY